jgi:membrane protein DedA with SNARE-associated domain
VSETLQAFLIQYGLIMVFVGSFFEGEAVVIAASFLAYQGILDPVGVAAASFAGSFTSDQVLFYVGRRYSGSRYVQRATEKRAFATALRLIEAHPVKFIMTFRFLYGLRIVSPIAVGFSNLSSRTYLVLNFISAVIWAVLFTALGYGFGRTIEGIWGTLREYETRVLIALAILIVVTALTILLIRWRKSHPMEIDPNEDSGR